MTAPSEELEYEPVLCVVRMFTNANSSAILGRTENGGIIHLVSMDEVNALREAGVPESVLDSSSWTSAVGQAKALGAVL